ncbi:MAG: toll/interleukin-1 receptor domain-containing protein [Dysgonamonadaceae bacterium]|jgi:hypothetical protein|nr:toll/interleukin-1 receptor domain-containing protein [Dysgonamonadaceae bacterium]
MVVFISHKKEDSLVAEYICKELKRLNVSAYLDVLEGEVLLKGEKLTNHIKERLNSCTDLLAVMTDKTKESWWVPFEIGMAAQRDFPIVSYLINNVELPDYLTYWPTLRKTTDLYKYTSAKKMTLQESATLKRSFNNLQRSETDAFYRNLRSLL